MPDPNLVPGKIIEVIKKRGPSLPIQIAKDVGISSLFASAFLSEMLENKKIKMSSLRVGGSPLYYIVGQEEQLDKFSNYLHPKEYEALELLKSKKYLKDSEQEPAIRVALRGIKDFAVNFKKDNETYWKLILTTEAEIKNLLEPTVEKKLETPVEEKIVPKIEEKIIEKLIEINKSEEIEKPYEENKPIEKVVEIITVKESPKIESEEEKPKKEKQVKQFFTPNQIQNNKLSSFENPLVEKVVEKPKKEKPKSEFVLGVINFLEKKGFRILEEKDHKAKEYLCLAEYNTDLGPICFLTYAKDKKSVSDEDLRKLLVESQKIPLPALFIAPGSLNKKAIEYQSNYYSILKTLKLS